MTLLRYFIFAATTALTATAATVSYSPVVGGITLSASANTDNIVSVPLAKSPVWKGTITFDSNATINTDGATVWNTNQLTTGSLHYLRVLEGSLAGHFFVITGNSSTAITVDSAGLDLSTIGAQTRAEIAPFWTLGTLYPASKAGIAFIASPSALSRQTELLFFDATSTGINRSSSAIYYFYNGSWRKAGTSVSTSFDNTIIYPDTYFIQRNKATPTSHKIVGMVQTGRISTILEASNTGPNDNFLAIPFPLALTLDQTGLANSGFSSSPSALNVTDQLLTFDPDQTGINRSANAIYFYYNGGWRKRGASLSTNYGSSVTILPGSGFIVRKATGGSSSTWFLDTQF